MNPCHSVMIIQVLQGFDRFFFLIIDPEVVPCDSPCFINGQVVVENGRLTTLDLPRVLRRHNEISFALIRGD